MQTLGIDRLSKSRVAEMARELDELVATFRTRPLDGGPYAYLWIDAQTQRCRDGGRVVNLATVTAIGVNAEGYLGCGVFRRLARIPQPVANRALVNSDALGDLALAPPPHVISRPVILLMAGAGKGCNLKWPDFPAGMGRGSAVDGGAPGGRRGCRDDG